MIDGDLLIVAWLLRDKPVIGSKKAMRGFFAQPLLCLQACPQLVWRGKRLQFLFLSGEVIELNDALAVGGISEGKPQNFRILFGLLQAISGRFVSRLGLHNGDHKVARVAQQVISTLGWPPSHLLSGGHDTAIGEGFLLGIGMRLIVPARLSKFRLDISSPA
jgi:hypothetical protein